MNKRIEKWKKKLSGDNRKRLYDEQKEQMVKLETAYFKDAEKIQNQVKQIIDPEPTILHHYYMDFAMEIYGLKKKHKSETLKNEVCILCCKWYDRGLNPLSLNKITELYLNMACFEIAPPVGSVIQFVGATAPAGYLLCDGSAVSRETYAKLFAVAGTTFGVGDGSTTFNLPDMRGIFPRGVGTQTIGVQNFTGVLGTTTGDSTAKPNTDFTTGNQSAAHKHDTVMGSHDHNYYRPNTGVQAVGEGPAIYSRTWTATSSTDLGTKTSDFEIIDTFPHNHTVTGGGDTETAPANLGLTFIIKY